MKLIILQLTDQQKSEIDFLLTENYVIWQQRYTRLESTRAQVEAKIQVCTE